jgi:FMN reductase
MDNATGNFTIHSEADGDKVPRRLHIVGIGGTTRPGSSSEAALRIALAIAAEMGATTEMITGPLLDLPMFDPSDEHRCLSARRLVQSLRRADGVIVSTPSYHGSLSGVIKNALDYVEDMRGDTRSYLDGRAVGIICAAHGVQGLGSTIMAVRSVIHALRAWPTPYAAAFNTADRPFVEGKPSGEAVRQQLAIVTGQVVDFARMHTVAASVTDKQNQKAALSA